MTDLPYTLDPDNTVRIGLLVLQADVTLETDMRRLMPPEVELLVSRVPSGTEVTTETLGEMEEHLAGAASLFPRGTALAAVGYGCTSATAQIGADVVARLIRSGVETACITEPVSALIAACGALSVERIGFVSPYVAEVSDGLRNCLTSAAIATPRFASFNEKVEANVARISGPSLAQAACEMGRDPACEAVFMSCTNLRTLDVIEEIEAEIGKPVLSSNQVLAWDLLRRTGVLSRGEITGRIWQV